VKYNNAYDVQKVGNKQKLCNMKPWPIGNDDSDDDEAFGSKASSEWPNVGLVFGCLSKSQ